MKLSALLVAWAALASVLPQDETAWPVARAAYGMAFEAHTGLTLVYGDRGPEASVLWGWDGTRWRRFDAPGPGLRRHVKLSYDAARRRTVLFGGLDDSGQVNYGDTWEWDGTRWWQVATEGPPPRGSYAMTYDPVRRRIVLFGGLSGTDGPLGDTWEWDGQMWTRMATTGPSPRGESGAVFDSATGRVLIAGGTSWQGRPMNGRTAWSSTPRHLWPRDTWAWDGRVWHLVAGDGPVRFGPLAPDPASGSPLRIGGDSDNGLLGNLLRLNGATWQPVPAAEIPSRFFHDASLDTARRRVVVFGGSRGGPAIADLWEWDGAIWHNIVPGSKRHEVSRTPL